MTDTTDRAFKADLAEIAVERFRKGEISRRGLLAMAVGLGLMPSLGSVAKAGATEIVVVNWGGIAAEFNAPALGETYTAETGVKVTIDGSGPSAGEIRAMVESGAVVWDLCDSGMGSAIILKEAGVIQPIDYDIVDKA